ncbi:MAG: cytochrome ubiquinol oxidase [Phenylobacterium sp.]|nr:cytochrome ubiquinol oxidase [Phenylobacterium sp.]
MTDLVSEALAYMRTHEALTVLMVFLMALAEAAPIIGLFVPATVILLGIGVLVGLGDALLWANIVGAAAGAVIGATGGHALGRHYRGRIVGLWPFSRWPRLLLDGKAFFDRWGTLSLAVGLFIPTVRPTIPVIAGMLGMKPVPFQLVNVTAALLWATALILPGALTGPVLATAGPVQTALLAAGALVVIGLLVAFVRRAWQGPLP